MPSQNFNPIVSFSEIKTLEPAEVRSASVLVADCVPRDDVYGLLVMLGVVDA